MKWLYVAVFSAFSLLEGLMALLVLWDGKWWFESWLAWPWWLYAAASFMFGSFARYEIRRGR